MKQICPVFIFLVFRQEKKSTGGKLKSEKITTTQHQFDRDAQ
jgi:hypothetical protein